MAAPNLPDRPEPAAPEAPEAGLLDRLAREIVRVHALRGYTLEDVRRILADAAPALDAAGERRGRHAERNRQQTEVWEVALEAEAKALTRERARCERLATEAGQPALALAIRHPAPARLPGCIPSYRHDDTTRPPMDPTAPPPRPAPGRPIDDWDRHG